MDIFKTMNKINAIGKYLIIAVFVVNLLSVSSGASAIGNALSQLCVISQTFLGAAAMVMIILAGATYAIGQVLGAETRARASVWATAMLTGAVVGIMIYVITPHIVAALLGRDADPENPCNFQIGDGGGSGGGS
ncbi:hypothetical protein GF318_01890 [Candidatus Micrarchaeota archaeon]|nr:hypothetical protein [Candidatus Micrarchaeota archaeon]